MYYIPEYPLAPVIPLQRPSLTEETAEAKVRAVEKAWNSQDLGLIALTCSPDSLWRERAESFRGRREIHAFFETKVATRIGLSPSYGPLVIYRESHCRDFLLRMARRLWQLVPISRQRAVALLRSWPHLSTHCLYQRRTYQ